MVLVKSGSQKGFRCISEDWYHAGAIVIADVHDCKSFNVNIVVVKWRLDTLITNVVVLFVFAVVGKFYVVELYLLLTIQLQQPCCSAIKSTTYDFLTNCFSFFGIL